MRDDSPGRPANEEFEAIRSSLGLRLDDGEAAVLQQIVKENQVFLATVDASPRSPSDDPFDFMRFVRRWRELHGK